MKFPSELAPYFYMRYSRLRSATRFKKRLAQACNFIQKETLAQVFSCEFSEIFKNIFFIEHLWWLILYLTLVNNKNTTSNTI